MFEAEGNFRPNNVSLGRLRRRFQKRFDLNGILQGVKRGKAEAAAFVMWGYDLLDLRALRPTKYPWATLIGISWLFRGYHHENSKTERKLLEIVDNDDSCIGFLQPDFYLRDRHEKNVWITDVEVITSCTEETSLLTSIREFAAETLCVGVFGMLHGYRCVDEVLLLAREQPEVRFVIAGKIFDENIRKDLLGDLKPGCRHNLLVSSGFIESEIELNAAIGSVDAVFLDGRNYPVQSGIVCRALHFGKWILSSDGDSWTNDVIAEGGVGFTYTARKSDLIQIWEEWKTKGGEDRSRAYSMRLRDPGTVAACFDEITDRLLNCDISES
jgi:glycosyltransferase involved in cell wall biosynthesis